MAGLAVHRRRLYGRFRGQQRTRYRSLGCLVAHGRLRFNFAGEQPPQLRDQSIEFYRFGIEFVTARGDCLFALAGEGVRGQSDHGDVASFRVALQPPGGFPAVR